MDSITENDYLYPYLPPIEKPRGIPPAFPPVL